MTDEIDPDVACWRATNAWPVYDSPIGHHEYGGSDND